MNRVRPAAPRSASRPAVPRPAPPAVRTATLVSAALLLASLPPSPLPGFVFIALVPWARAVRTLPPPLAARAGAGLFAAFWGPALLWIVQAGLRVGPWTLAGWSAVVLSLTLLGALFGWTFAHLHRGARWPLPAALAGAWVGVEVLRGSALGPLSFDWLGIAVALTAVPAWIQGAAWVGEAGLALAVTLVNGLLVAALDGSRRHRWITLATLILGMAFATGGGARRIAQTPLVDLGAWVAVQPDVPLALRRGPEAFAASVAAVEALLPAARAEAMGAARAEAVGAAMPPDAMGASLPAAPGATPARAVLLPETVLEGPPRLVDPVLARWQAALGVPLVTGAERRTAGRRTNSVVLVRDGVVRARTDKVRLVPGVEWAPGGADRWWAGAPAVLPLPGGVRLAALVCIESASSQPARSLVQSGADLIVNVTNDAWLAERPWFTRHPAFEQHPAHLALRAVELGRGALRVANNGRTGSIDAFGRWTSALEPHRPGVARLRGSRLAGDTPYLRGGWWLRWIVLGCATLGVLLARTSAGRSRMAAAGAGRPDNVAR